jgi:hypothetical protein
MLLGILLSHAGGEEAMMKMIGMEAEDGRHALQSAALHHQVQSLMFLLS